MYLSEIAAASQLEGDSGLKFLKNHKPCRFYLAPKIIQSKELSAEIEYLRSLRRKEIEEGDKSMAEQLNEEIAESEGALIECGCCYSDYSFEKMVQCTEGHLFCKDCVRRLTEQTVFGGGRSDIKCMNTQEECTGTFSESMLSLVLSDKALAKYSESLARDALEAAKIDFLIKCHKCEMQYDMTDYPGDILRCPSCDSKTCRHCGVESHYPLKCEEVEKEGETANRHKVEEAMTNARLRTCSKCGTKFFKEDGCNKMTCRCGTKTCYICRKTITKEGYKHFCQVSSIK